MGISQYMYNKLQRTSHPKTKLSQMKSYFMDVQGNYFCTTVEEQITRNTKL